ncbi:acyl-CoA dehydrogenase NM domain-like protein [Sparassis latifolia]
MSTTTSPRRTIPLVGTPPFTTAVYSLDTRDRSRLSYEKARSVGLAYDLSFHDISSLSQKFWDLHFDPVVLLDGSAFTLLTIHYNLCAGTIASYASRRPELRLLVEDLLRFRTLGQYMLTEVGHGLDAHNLETTATLLPSGEFLLNSPTPQSAKFMPPTVPAGTPCIAVVFARLLVNKEDFGIHPFVVPLNDGFQMCTGVQARQLPAREGPNPVNHAITTFRNVRLPRTSLLGALEKPRSFHNHVLQITSRVNVGTMALSCLGIPFMQCYATIGTMYSLRRTTGPPDHPEPILQFRTQQLPLLTVAAQVSVLSAFQRWATNAFCTMKDIRIRRGIAAIAKAIAVQHSQEACLAVSERCGAQGLFAHNQMTRLHAEMRGLAIAEGDILGLSIRLATELLLGRYVMPAPENPTSLLALHEAGIFEEARDIITSVPHHRSVEVNRLILPRCQALVEAIGHRMAYDAAVAAGVKPCLIDLYVANVVKLDPAWYSENTRLGRRAQAEMETKALDETLPLLGSLVREMDVGPYISAPIVSDERWSDFVASLEVFEGTAKVGLPTDDTPAFEMVRAQL